MCNARTPALLSIPPNNKYIWGSGLGIHDEISTLSSLVTELLDLLKTSCQTYTNMQMLDSWPQNIASCVVDCNRHVRNKKNEVHRHLYAFNNIADTVQRGKLTMFFKNNPIRSKEFKLLNRACAKCFTFCRRLYMLCLNTRPRVQQILQSKTKLDILTYLDNYRKTITV